MFVTIVTAVTSVIYVTLVTFVMVVTIITAVSMLNLFPIMLALCLMLYPTNYAKTYAGIMVAGLQTT